MKKPNKTLKKVSWRLGNSQRVKFQEFLLLSYEVDQAYHSVGVNISDSGSKYFTLADKTLKTLNS